MHITYCVFTLYNRFSLTITNMIASNLYGLSRLILAPLFPVLFVTYSGTSYPCYSSPWRQSKKVYVKPMSKKAGDQFYIRQCQFCLQETKMVWCFVKCTSRWIIDGLAVTEGSWGLSRIIPNFHQGSRGWKLKVHDFNIIFLCHQYPRINLKSKMLAFSELALASCAQINVLLMLLISMIIGSNQLAYKQVLATLFQEFLLFISLPPNWYKIR